MEKIDYELLYDKCCIRQSCIGCIYKYYCDLLDCDAIDEITKDEYNEAVKECEVIETI